MTLCIMEGERNDERNEKGEASVAIKNVIKLKKFDVKNKKGQSWTNIITKIFQICNPFYIPRSPGVEGTNKHVIQDEQQTGQKRKHMSKYKTIGNKNQTKRIHEYRRRGIL